MTSAYTMTGSTADWLDRMLDGVHRYLGSTRGNAYLYTLNRRTGAVAKTQLILHDVERGFFDDSHAAMPREAVVTLFKEGAHATSLATGVPALYARDPFIRTQFPKVGVTDMLGVHAPMPAIESESAGCFVVTYLRDVPTQRRLRELTRLALHMRVAISLRESGFEELPDTSTAEARTILHGVLEGNWIVVHVDDGDGERRMVLRPTDPGSRLALQREELRVLELSARGMSGKQIAIDLGMVESVVSKLWRRGMGKLGARTRAELVVLLHLAGR